MGKDLKTLAEKAGLKEEEMPGLADLKDHLKDLNAHTHDVMSHVAHVETEMKLEDKLNK
ncbi:MAG: hypothetical protein HF978_07795 [Desulfobacteraceae bacterium]|nr:hypothetical protein [Desulfobacteraceae bacterium]MBC2755432.1 hypothetical protein [Desulfobacteraceae bacterium]